MIENYFIHIMIIIGIYGILAISLNLVMGYCGLLNLGHIAFFGIGAYSSALLTLKGGTFPVSFLLSGLIASSFGYLLAYATKRLRGDYFALITLGFNFVVYSLMLNLTSLTGGPMGLIGIPKPTIAGISLGGNLLYFFILVLVVFISTYFIARKLTVSFFGKLMAATRDNELLLKTLGKTPIKIKAKVLAFSAFFAGISGSLYVHYIGFVDPTIFGLTDMILIITIVILGGLASLEGTIISTILLISLPELLRFVTMPDSVLGPLRWIIYALVLLLILGYRSRGIFGNVDLT